VDDVTIPSPQNGWLQDPWTTYSEFCVLGVADTEINRLVKFPNPADSVLYLEAAHPIDRLSVYSLEGKLLMEHHAVSEIDVTTLPTGMYFIQIFSMNSTVTKKFVKQ
jgi:hypothetical protein